MGPYSELTNAGLKDAHHITECSSEDLPNYSKGQAPAVQLDGPSNKVGTPHYNATHIAQRTAGGGTYAAERRVGYRALRIAGYSVKEAKAAIKFADEYFKKIGVNMDTKN